MTCGKHFKASGTAKRHIREVHMPKTQQTFTCHVCNKVFYRERSRDEHRSAAHGITKQMMKNATLWPYEEVQL